MEEKNSVWGYILVAVVTIVIGVGIGLGISYFTKEDKEPNVVVDNDNNWEENNSQTNTDEQNENKNEINDWTDYVLNQEITEMYIAIWGEDENQQPYSRNINITKKELSNIFTEMKKAKITKRSIGGSGDSTPELVVKYKNNYNEYTLSMPYASIVWAEYMDPNLKTLIEKENYEIDPNYEINLDTFYDFDWNGTEYLNKLIENK